MEAITVHATLLGIVVCGYVAILCLADVYLIVVHLLVGPTRLREEHAFLEAQAEIPMTCPLVCVQLPVHNEPESVEAAIDSLCALDWPKNQLEIMILDDSTDHTSNLIAARVRQWQSRGVSIRRVFRRHRSEFKAGALARGLRYTVADFIAVFDVDYRPRRDFLRLAMAGLAAQSNAAFVQVRIDYRNRDRNALTRAQAMELDMSMAYEQAACAWAGIPSTFNGTGGIWRRSAIQDAGGWSGRSLVEDRDLSRRAFAEGWSQRYLVTIAVAGELPESFDVLAQQRRRWAMGTGQAFRAMPWQLLSHLRRLQAVVFTLLLLFHSSLMISLFATSSLLGIVLITDRNAASDLCIALILLVALIVLLKSMGAALSTRVTGRSVDGRFFLDLACMWLMEVLLVPALTRAQWEGLFLRRIPFARTRKKG